MAKMKEDFMKEVSELVCTDRRFFCFLKSVRVKSEEGKDFALIDGSWVEMHETAIKCLYERSGEDMRANNWLPVGTQFEIMNQYCFPYLPADKRGLVIIRDGKLLALHSNRYEYYEQTRLLNAFFQEIEANGATYSFMSGTATNRLTRCEVRIDHADLLADYQRSAVRAGYNEFIRKGSFISFVFVTNDIGTCDVEVFPVLHVAGKTVFMNNNIGNKPFSLVHKDTGMETTLQHFQEKMKSLFVTAKVEAENIGKLMSISITNPTRCIQKCIKKLKLKNLSARGLDEFESQISYANLDSAFQIYLTMYDFLETPTVKALSREKREKIARVIRTLVVEDWNKLQ